MHGISLPALVPGHRLHHRRLAHDDRASLGQNRLHRPDHRRRPGTADLFIKGQGQLQRPAHPAGLRIDQREYRDRIESFHVAGASPVIPAVLLDNLERVGVPGLTINRHHVGMSRQHDRALLPGADMRKQRRLGLIRVTIAVGGYSVAVQILLDPVDQRQVGIAADRRERHQPVHDRPGAEYFGHLNIRCPWSEHNAPIRLRNRPMAEAGSPDRGSVTGSV